MENQSKPVYHGLMKMLNMTFGFDLFLKNEKPN